MNIDWSVFWSASVVAAIISFGMNRTYDYWVSHYEKSTRFNFAKDTLIASIETDQPVLRHFTGTVVVCSPHALCPPLPVQYAADLYRFCPDVQPLVVLYYKYTRALFLGESSRDNAAMALSVGEAIINTLSGQQT